MAWPTASFRRAESQPGWDLPRPHLPGSDPDRNLVDGVEPLPAPARFVHPPLVTLDVARMQAGRAQAGLDDSFPFDAEDAAPRAVVADMSRHQRVPGEVLRPRTLLGPHQQVGPVNHEPDRQRLGLSIGTDRRQPQDDLLIEPPPVAGPE